MISIFSFFRSDFRPAIIIILVVARRGEKRRAKTPRKRFAYGIAKNGSRFYTNPVKKLFLIDGNSLFHRAFHAIPPLNSPSGEVVNAVFGFANMLTHIIQTMKPDFMAVAFDHSKKTFRHEEFPEYKATRAKAPDELYAQFPLAKEFLSVLSVPFFEVPGFEADDILGTLAKQYHGPDIEIVIVTADRDAIQLVGDQAVVAAPFKGFSHIIFYDRSEVQKKWGIAPEQFVDFKALAGDASDNIPGVFGIGEKTALSLLKQYGTLENIYTHLAEIPGALQKKLADNKDSAFLSQRLCTICTDVPVSFTLKDGQILGLDRQEVLQFFGKLGFKSLISRMKPKADAGEKQGTLF